MMACRDFVSSPPVSLSKPTIPVFKRWGKVPSSSKTYAIPPDIPAPKFFPVGPKTTIVPRVIYSQP